MADVAFYHLTKFRLEDALPKLLEKTLGLGKKAQVMVSDEARAEHLADHLWSYQPDSWLAHGTAKDGHAEAQPIWISPHEDNQNSADFLFLCEGCMKRDIASYERCFILIDGQDGARVQQARSQWKDLKDQGVNLTYWQQTDQGGWEKKS